MSKLFKLKKWLSVADAAEQLALVFGEKVTESDVLLFVLDGALDLSVHLVNGAFGSPCVQMNIEAIEWDELPSLIDGKRTIRIPKGGRVWQDERGIFQVQNIVIELDDDVYDLPMRGGEKIDIEHLYQFLVGGPERTAVSLDGVLVSTSDGRLFEIKERYESLKPDSSTTHFLHPEKFHPAGALPEDSVFVVRTVALTKFIQSLNGDGKADAKPLGTTERNTLLTIIAVLCKEAKIDYTKHSKAGLLIQDMAAQMGISIGDSSIEGHFKKIPEALRTRMK